MNLFGALASGLSMVRQRLPALRVSPPVANDVINSVRLLRFMQDAGRSLVPQTNLSPFRRFKHVEA